MTPRCYAREVQGGSVRLSAEEAHHLGRVLRLEAGAAVIVFDGRGNEWDGRLGAVASRTATVDALSPRDPLPEPPVAVTLAIGLLKGDQMTTVVRDATVLGAAAIVPFASAHTARPAGLRGDRERARWERVAVAAAKQCGRSVVPAIEPATLFPEILGRDAAWRVTCVEPRKSAAAAGVTAAPGAEGAPRVPTAVLFVGPEGGWSADELRRLEEAGTERLDLGPRTLRAELAPAVALTVLWTRWGWRGDHV